MRRTLLSTFAMVVILLALSSPSPAAGKHPQIEAALESLRAAREHLNNAEHDFHGHRAAALNHVNEAIKEAQICMQEP